MAEVKRAKKLKLALGDITNDLNNDSDINNNGIQILNHKRLFEGFGGPGWRKKLQSEQLNENDLKMSLDMDIDDYMQNKDKNLISIKTEYEEKGELDMDLDKYMAQAKKSLVNNNININNQVIETNGSH